MKKDACNACLTNCKRLHGDEEEETEEEIITPAAGSSRPGRKQDIVAPGAKESGRPAEPSPSFLKKMVDLSMTSALQMPASFVKSFGTRIGTKVTLEGPGNEKWEVQVGPGKENYTLEFRDGWYKFVVDHVLQIGDQLSFTLGAESSFQVMVYDESGSQKTSATDAINSPRTLLKAKAAVLEVDQGGGAGPSVPFRNKPSARPKQKVRRRIRTDAVLVKPECVSAPVVLSSESELRNGSDTPEKVRRSKEAIHKDVEEEEESDPGDDDDEILLPPHVIVDGQVVSQRRPVTQAEKERTLLAARALPITNPKLVVVMSRAYVYRGFWMALSRPFAKAYMPKETREVTMLNMAGRKWTVKWLFKETGSGFSAGWRGFALDHRLEEGDVIVFELLDQKNYVMVVHIFRVLGGTAEDTRDYSCTPRKSRNIADWTQTPTGFKRKGLVDTDTPGPSSLKKIFNTSPGKYKSAVPVRCSEIDQDPGYCKKAKASPATSCEVYADYAAFVPPPVGSGKETFAGPSDLGATDLMRLPKQSPTAIVRESCRNDLLKLGKELVQSTNLSGDSRRSSSSSAKSEGSEERKLVQPIHGTATMDQDLNQVAGTCACVSENHV